MEQSPTILDQQTFQYTRREELANAITHGLGIIFGFFVLTDLLMIAYERGSWLRASCYFVYGVSLITLYSASTFYHLAKTKKVKDALKKLDHISIYFLIAGSYTPFLLLNVGGSFGFKFCIGIWITALLGTFAKFKISNKRIKLSVFFYLIMGWAIMFAWNHLVAAVPSPIISWLIYGGCFYSFGTLFYIMKKMPHHHMIWHLFVLSGSVCHYVSIRLAA
ncbi:MAG: hemolysin III family protein [Deltaproteobacteria bacterium]|nr:MAG: hemolysin III family protein [Deltaproteobacteria bacterium]